MLIAQRVNRFIASIYPRQVCDQCVCAELKLRNVTQASPTTVALGTTRDFRREIAACHLCGSTRMTTSATPDRAALLEDA